MVGFEALPMLYIMKVQDFINSYLENTLRQIKNHLAEADSICHLASLNYENMQSPDYSDKIMREYYLLRYFYAYFAEYHYIYNWMIDKKLLTNPITVASIGCGAGIDFYALKMIKVRDFNYFGFDIINWGFNEPEAFFNIANIANITLPNVNVIMFPKSLSEFSHDDFNLFVERLNPCALRYPLCIISSMMYEGGEYDIERIKILEKKICDAGFVSINDSSQTFQPEEPSCYRLISARCPDAVTEFLSNIKTFCNISEPKCNDCQINKSPILRTDYMRFQILFFQSPEELP